MTPVPLRVFANFAPLRQIRSLGNYFMRITLTITGQNGDSTRRDFSEGTHVIGREPSCAVRFEGSGSEHVSWNHAQLSLRDDGVYLSDLDSSNGTYLNDRKLAVETKILDGDRIQLGRKGPKIVVESVGFSVEDTLVQSATSGPLDPPSAKPAAKSGGSPFERSKSGPPPLLAKEKPADRSSPSTVTEPAAGSSTRQLLIGMQKSQRGWRIFAFVTAGVLVIGVVVALIIVATQGGDEDDKPPENSPNVTQGSDIYRNTLQSTAWIIKIDAKSTGTGSLIDKERRLVVTNHHVVGNNKRATVIFPEFKDGEAISDRMHYIKKVRAFVRKGNGTVLVNDPSKDIAVIQLDKAPENVPELSLVERSATPGTRLHTVGNPGAGSALWSYSVGAVRQVAKIKIKKASGVFDGWTLETQNPINSGDSGGPVVNDDGQLVAINMATRNQARLVTLCVDIREVRKALELAVTRAKP